MGRIIVRDHSSTTSFQNYVDEALYHMTQHDPIKALFYYHQAMDIIKFYSNTNCIKAHIHTLINMGVAYFLIGEYDNAYENFSEALSMSCPNSSNTSEGFRYAIGNICAVYIQINRFDIALIYGLSIATLNLSAIYLSLDPKNLDMSLHYLKISFMASSMLGDNLGKRRSISFFVSNSSLYYLLREKEEILKKVAKHHGDLNYQYHPLYLEGCNIFKPCTILSTTIQKLNNVEPLSNVTLSELEIDL